MSFFAPKVTMFQLNKAGSSWISLGSSGYLIMARTPSPQHPDKKGTFIYSTISDHLNSDKHCRYNKLDYTTIEILWWDISLLSRNKHLHYSIKYGFKKKGDSAVVTKAFNLRTQKTEIIAIRFGSNDRIKICQTFRNTFWSILEDLCEDKKTLFTEIKNIETWSCVACDNINKNKQNNSNKCLFCNAYKPSPWQIIKDHVIGYDEDEYGDDNGDDKDDDNDQDENDLLLLRYDWKCPSCAHTHNKKWKNKKLNVCDNCLYNCPFIMNKCKHCQQFKYLGMNHQ